MFAVVHFAGRQYRLREKDEIEMDKIEVEAGKNFKIPEVLLMGEEDGSHVKIGMPFVPGAHVECQVVEHGRGEKIRVFTYQSKKRRHTTQGHRQDFTLVKVLKISAVEKKTAPVEKAVKAEAEVKAEKAPAKKAAAPKKAPAKKANK